MLPGVRYFGAVLSVGETRSVEKLGSCSGNVQPNRGDSRHVDRCLGWKHRRTELPGEVPIHASGARGEVLCSFMSFYVSLWYSEVGKLISWIL